MSVRNAAADLPILFSVPNNNSHPSSCLCNKQNQIQPIPTATTASDFAKPASGPISTSVRY